MQMYDIEFPGWSRSALALTVSVMVMPLSMEPKLELAVSQKELLIYCLLITDV
jgi:hypothetical protein